RTQGWWQLESNIDHSILVVFGYQLAVTDGALPAPIEFKDVTKLGKRFFPDPDLPSGDPDAPEAPISSDATAPPAIASVNQSVLVNIAPTWVIVAFGLTTCKERADFEPGQVLGAGRIYPHVMVTCNQGASELGCQISVVRPSHTMSMPGSEMLPDIGA